MKTHTITYKGIEINFYYQIQEEEPATLWHSKIYKELYINEIWISGINMFELLLPQFEELQEELEKSLEKLLEK